ncbi:MAG: hypothetical protein QOF55_2321, partial [Thermoleophilaceae bacterium]|nr:hypothetical protein [Thermoleophilaceae bacterium]
MSEALDFTSDFYDIESVLADQDRELLASVRRYMREEV